RLPSEPVQPTLETAEPYRAGREFCRPEQVRTSLRQTARTSVWPRARICVPPCPSRSDCSGNWAFAIESRAVASDMDLSIVIPVFNEVEVLPALLTSLSRVMNAKPYSYEIIFIDDGSTDGTTDLLRHTANESSNVKVLFFSRNFGHQAAITAGLDFAQGDAVVVMDADLQDPPEILPRMVELFEEGYDVVSPKRLGREGETWFKRWTAALFYRLLARMADRRLAADVGDFRLFSRRAVLAIRSFREQHRFMRGLIAWLGLKEAILPFERQPRAAGETKYPFWKMLRFAWTAVSSFSALPLRLSL